MKKTCPAILAIVIMLLAPSCSQKRIDVIFDTDANNELDDQHAIAYLLLNDKTFNTLGITTNTTRNGGDITLQTLEARRVTNLVGKGGTTVLEGADASFEEILPTIGNSGYDGEKAVTFIIDQALKHSPEKPLTVIAVGKLTNLALAIAREPSITSSIRLVWLGSNYPEKGEYNFDNDIPSVNYVLDSDVPFEMVLVANGTDRGTEAVKVSQEFVHTNFAGLGPRVTEPVEGRHGNTFTCFGDYAIDLFENMGDEERALYDMSAVAIVKNPAWAVRHEIPAPVFNDGAWVERPDNKRVVSIWEYFDRDSIIEDFISTLKAAE